MEYEFSQDTLQRATYLFERDILTDISDYSIEYHKLCKNTKLTPSAAKYLLIAEKQIFSRSSSIDIGETPYWVSFFSVLISKPKNIKDSKVGIATYKILEPYFSKNIYAHPFLTAAESFAVDIHLLYYKKCSRRDAPRIYADLITWFLSRAIETSRFVLHYIYSRSKLPYPEWCALFKHTDASLNPWFEIVEEFPVLVRMLSDINNSIKESIDEFFYRLRKDRVDLEAQFGINQDTKLSNIKTGLSDPHRGGRSVMRITFNNNSTLIYKPKQMDIEAEFNKLASKHGKHFGICALNILSRTSYGWAEDVEESSINEKYFRNPEAIGRAAACFWLLNATDLHFENVRPSKNGLFALDVETLFSTPIKGSIPKNEVSWRRHSIITTLLFNSSIGSDRQLLNISGFDSSPNHVSPSPQIHFEIENNYVKLIVLPARKDSTGSEFSTTQYPSKLVQCVIQGFESVFEGCGRKYLNDFISNLDDKCKLRLVPRSTEFYNRILERMRQPRFLRDGALLSLDLLSLHAGVPKDSAIQNEAHITVENEIRQLLKGDIPYFSYEVGDTALYSSNRITNNFFALSAKSHALAKIQEIESCDLIEQSTLLAISLGRNYLKKINTVQNTIIQSQPSTCLTSDFLPKLKILVDEIVTSAFCPANSPARWLSLIGDVSGNNLKVEAGDTGYFGGSWGILLALQSANKALFGHLDISVLHIFLEKQALLWKKHLEQQVNDKHNNASEVLGFAGIGGEIFSQSTLISLDRRRWGFLESHIGSRLKNIEKTIKSDIRLDVIGGAAGFILGCEQFLKLGVASKWESIVTKLQNKSAMHLLKSSKTYKLGGYSWVVPGEKNPLLGFAHGWSGIITSLSIACRRFSSKSQLLAIENCLRESVLFPHNLYKASHKWGDYRVGTSGIKGNSLLNESWCNGIPGLLRGLFETNMYWTEEIRIGALSLYKKIQISSSTGVHRFCCGEMGNVDFLLDYSRVKDSSEIYKNAYFRVLNSLNEMLSSMGRIEKQNLPEFNFPGLFHGQSGIVYCAARFILPELPSLSGQHMEDISFIDQFIN